MVCDHSERTVSRETSLAAPAVRTLLDRQTLHYLRIRTSCSAGNQVGPAEKSTSRLRTILLLLAIQIHKSTYFILYVLVDFASGLVLFS